ncbi:iron-containing alcohol dehydrogenase [Nocardioides sp. LHG3406-4]|uniref:iron-containing alcohol dehydrogenase n=1 Tax=Nocardioides sp. LHG3406-4 TaxID=2804575 RepID=UPI003CF53858
MTAEFVHSETNRTVHFGRDLLSQAEKLLGADFDDLYLITTERLAEPVDELARRLGVRHAHTQVGAPMHTPVTAIDRALHAFDENGAGSVLAVGGGSVIGLAKALARRRQIPIAAATTTYAGSEMTPVWGETSDGQKTTGRDENVRPRVVIYDVALTETMPLTASVASGFNALAHAMEAMYARDATPVSDAIATRAVANLCASVTTFSEVAGAIETGGQDGHRSLMVVARSQALQGAWLAGHVLGSTTMSLHHKLCHLLGGSYNLPHAETHAVLLPHVLALCAETAPGVYRTFANALQTAAPDAMLHRVATAARVPTTLQQLGVSEDELNALASRLIADTGDRGHYDFDPSLAVTVLRNAWSNP